MHNFASLNKFRPQIEPQQIVKEEVKQGEREIIEMRDATVSGEKIKKKK